MQSIRQVERLNGVELEKVVPSNASWHTDYRDTAYIYIGGLPFELSEGDILTIFSQYGNPVHINLVRDKETGKSRGYCFLKYEDQRSCDLAVDNLSGAGVMGRVVSVDHTRYKKKDGEVEGVGDEEEIADDTDEEGASRSKRRRTESASESEAERPLIKEEVDLAKLRRDMDDDDPMKAYMVKEKQAEVDEALKAVVKRKEQKSEKREHKHRHRHHRSKRDDAEGDGEGKRDRHSKSKRERDEARSRDRPRHTRSPTPDGSGVEDRDKRQRSSRDSDEGDRKRERPLRRRDRSSEPRSRSRQKDRRRWA
ncbi:RNA-binding protein Cwf29 [Elasticomyces elasticus]|nr:RNA-binding protein Cwf29 [Elasticomyces elasticus]KAK3660143.1 RNA-binding protein Cwf29 [Elasticomyces elasticus]KAK4923448.1 RNA-binding protein Cwf29 [Elasticomyces elasticus]KAK5752320.1 RNA-binding protein Cwf29 [Elasticomyces elasticus]